jgi:SnoaL-like domain
VADRFAAALAGGDVDGVVALLTDDAWFTMPPVTLEYQGPVAIAGFVRDSAAWRGPRRYRLVPTRANGQPAFGFYIQDEHEPTFRRHGMIVLTLEGDRISAITRFIDNGVMGCFGLPQTLDADERSAYR